LLFQFRANVFAVTWHGHQPNEQNINYRFFSDFSFKTARRRNQLDDFEKAFPAKPAAIPPEDCPTATSFLVRRTVSG